jgi:hypothetical protein
MTSICSRKSTVAIIATALTATAVGATLVAKKIRKNKTQTPTE